MAASNRIVSEAVRLELLKRMEAGENVTKLADEVGVSRQRLYDWREHVRVHGDLKSRRRGRPSKLALIDPSDLKEQASEPSPSREEKALTKAYRKIKDLERKVGQQQLDIDFFQEALRHIGEDHRRNSEAGETRSSKSLKR